MPNDATRRKETTAITGNFKLAFDYLHFADAENVKWHEFLAEWQGEEAKYGKWIGKSINGGKYGGQEEDICKCEQLKCMSGIIYSKCKWRKVSYCTLTELWAAIKCEQPALFLISPLLCSAELSCSVVNFRDVHNEYFAWVGTLINIRAEDKEMIISILAKEHLVNLWPTERQHCHTWTCPPSLQVIFLSLTPTRMTLHLHSALSRFSSLTNCLSVCPSITHRKHWSTVINDNNSVRRLAAGESFSRSGLGSCRTLAIFKCHQMKWASLSVILLRLLLLS